MQTTSWTLLDVEQGIHLDPFHCSEETSVALAGTDHWSVSMRRLRGGISEGVDVVEIDNGRLKFSVLPTRGMGLWKGTCDGLDLGWKSPVTLPVHPTYVNALDRNGIGWLAGFNEWLCRCGLDSNGPPTDSATLHGRIANLPAHTLRLRVDPAGEIELTGIVDEAQMFGPRLQLTSTVKTRAGSNRLTIVDTVANLGSKPADLELLYHINQGPPFLEAGAKLVAPIREVSARNARALEGLDTFDEYAAPDSAYSEQVYLFDLAQEPGKKTIAMLRSADGSKGFSVHYDSSQMPCFTQWKNTQAIEDGYVTGLEPGTNYPNPKSYERQQGRVIALAPRGSHTIELELAVHSTKAAVQEVEREIAAAQATTTRTVHRSLQPKFAAP